MWPPERSCWASPGSTESHRSGGPRSPPSYRSEWAPCVRRPRSALLDAALPPVAQVLRKEAQLRQYELRKDKLYPALRNHAIKAREGLLVHGRGWPLV